MTFPKNKQTVIVWVIFFCTLLLRLYRLGSIPHNFQEDEVLSGYVGRFILTNGVDLYNNSWPLLYFNKFGDYYIILPMYLAGLSTFLFGVNEFAVRFPAAMMGSIIVFPLYYLTNWIFRSKTVGLIAAGLLAILPWHLVLSRSMVEGVIGSTIFLTAIVFLGRSLDEKNIKPLLLSAVLSSITYFIYHPFRMYVPLLFLGTLVIYWNQLKKQKNIWRAIIICTVLFFGLTYYISTTSWGKGRFVQTSIFSELSGVSIRIQQQIFNSGNDNILIARFFHNKVIGYGREFIHQYLSYFSPEFLFTKGGAESRYDVPDQGLFYLTFLILLILAVVPLPLVLKEKIDSRKVLFLLWLLVIAPFPAAFTYFGSPNVHRALFLSVPLVIIASWGAYRIAQLRFGKVLLSALLLILAAEFVYFWHQYSVQSDIYTALNRNDAHKELVQYVRSVHNQYETIYLPVEGAMPLYYLFYSEDFDNKYATQFGMDAKIDRIDSITFIDNSCPTEHRLPDNPDQKVLVVNRHNCPQDIANDTLHLVTEIKGKSPLLGFKVYSN